MYWSVPTLYNPSLAGKDTLMHISVMDRMQWVGVDGAPQTFFASVDMPFKLKQKKCGVGLTATNDKAGLFTTTNIAAQFAYNIKSKYGRLALGLQVGMINQGFNAGEIYMPDGDAWDQSDESIPTSTVSAMSIDLGLGALYEFREFYAGLSVQHLNKATMDLDEYAYSQESRTFYFLGGCNIPVRGTLFLIQPSVLVKTANKATQTDCTLRASYDNRFWGGVSYRFKDAVVLMVGANIQSFRIGYAYDIGTSALAKVSNGSHEVMLSYTLNIDLGHQANHIYKSIRIL